MSVLRTRSITLALFAAGVVALWSALPGCGGSGISESPSSPAPSLGATDEALGRAFADHASGLEVEGAGTVGRVLADDNEGARHQRFIMRLASGQTLLVAHNIDIAPRVEGLAVGDVIAFRGVYEWNAEGGTVHWTHRDPGGVHAAGWLRFDGRLYE